MTAFSSDWGTQHLKRSCPIDRSIWKKIMSVQVEVQDLVDVRAALDTAIAGGDLVTAVDALDTLDGYIRESNGPEVEEAEDGNEGTAGEVSDSGVGQDNSAPESEDVVSDEG